MAKILVIDDEEGLRSMVTIILRRRGYEVLEASNGSEGLEMVRQHLPDLVLSDINMELTDGYGVVTTLRSDPATAAIPVILMTGFASTDGMRQGMELGADDYLPKPFSSERLLATVEARLKKLQAMQQRAEQVLSDLRASLSLSLPHELNTPLVGIIGLTEIIIAESDSLPPHIVEMVQNIAQCGTRLHRLIENFLLFAQIEVLASNPADLIEFGRRTSSSLPELLEPVARDCASMVNRGSDLALELAPCRLGISDDLLTKLVREIVDNAFKYSKPGSLVRLAVVVGPALSQIIVEDHGRGMETKDIKSIGAFMQFQRKIHEQQGSGLGLTLARRLTEIHSGKIDMVSEPGRGTTVTIKLPSRPL